MGEQEQEQQQQNQPVHWDNHRSRYNLALVFALGIAAMGVLNWSPMLLIFGLAVAGYSWFTTPKLYLIYPQALIIVYGRPRVKVFPFTEISHAELLNTAIGQRLRVRLVNRQTIMVQARNPEEFGNRLEEALKEFGGTNKQQETPEEDPDSPLPY